MHSYLALRCKKNEEHIIPWRSFHNRPGDVSKVEGVVIAPFKATCPHCKVSQEFAFADLFPWESPNLEITAEDESGR